MKGNWTCEKFTEKSWIECSGISPCLSLICKDFPESFLWNLSTWLPETLCDPKISFFLDESMLNWWEWGDRIISNYILACGVTAKIKISDRKIGCNESLRFSEILFEQGGIFGEKKGPQNAVKRFCSKMAENCCSFIITAENFDYLRIVCLNLRFVSKNLTIFFPLTGWKFIELVRK